MKEETIKLKLKTAKQIQELFDSDRSYYLQNACVPRYVTCGGIIDVKSEFATADPHPTSSLKESNEKFYCLVNSNGNISFTHWIPKEFCFPFSRQIELDFDE